MSQPARPSTPAQRPGSDPGSARPAELERLIPHIMVDFNQMKTFAEDPLILVAGEGIRVTDHLGATYIDGISGVFSVSLGHSATAVVDAMTAQLRRLAFASPILATNERALELVDQLMALSGGRMHVAKLLNSGSEATEAAMKMARQFHKPAGQAGRFKVISLYRSYHGATLGALSATGWPKLRAPYEPLASGFVHVPPPMCGDLKPHDHSACARAAAEQCRAVIDCEGPDTIAALIVEPVMLTAGVHPLPVEYLGALRQICDETGILLIFDELVTAFGRLGSWFAAERFGVWPDLMCLGKGISSGYAPLSVVLMTDRVGRAFWGEPQDNLQFQAGHTHASNPVSAAAGLATIKALQDQQVFQNVERSGRRLAERLRELAEDCEYVSATRCIGLLAGVEFGLDRESGVPFPESVPVAVAVQRAARRRGLLLRASPHINTFAPPLVTTPEEVDEIAGIYAEAVAEVCDILRGGGQLDTSVGFGL